MSSINSSNFDFDFRGESHSDILEEAARTLHALDYNLGDEDNSAPKSPEERAASKLLRQLNEHVAEFGVNPQVLELKEKHFELHGWPVPLRFRDLSKKSRFYWMRVPVILNQLEDMPFSKLQLGIEFNPGELLEHLRPISVMIFPDRKVRQLANFRQGMALRIGENLDFEVATGKLDFQTGDAKVKFGAGVDTSADANLALTIGPFSYDLKKIELDHSTTGSEKVFWSVNSTRYLHDERPTFVVVIQVPKEVQEFRIAAAMQAYHKFDVFAASISNVIRYFTKRVASFFREGAPIPAEKVWDVTPRLN